MNYKQAYMHYCNSMYIIVQVSKLNNIGDFFQLHYNFPATMRNVKITNIQCLDELFSFRLLPNAAGWRYKITRGLRYRGAKRRCSSSDEPSPPLGKPACLGATGEVSAAAPGAPPLATGVFTHVGLREN